MNIKSFLLASACFAVLHGATAAEAGAAPDPFLGIYAQYDPISGELSDVYRVTKWRGAYQLAMLESPAQGWNYMRDVKLMQPSDPYAVDAIYPQHPRVATLAAEDRVYLHHVPDGIFSRAGRSETGYVFLERGKGLGPLERRPLGYLAGETKYSPKKGELEIALRGLNYSGRLVEFLVSSPDDSANEVGTESIRPYASSTSKCCLFVPPSGKETTTVNVQYRFLPDGPSIKKLMTLPMPVSSANLWMVLHEDESLELVVLNEENKYDGPDTASWPGKIKQYPRPPVAYRAQRATDELRRKRQMVGDMIARRSALPESAAAEVREAIYMHQQMLLYTESRLACAATGADFKFCHSKAISDSARAIRER